MQAILTPIICVGERIALIIQIFFGEFPVTSPQEPLGRCQAAVYQHSQIVSKIFCMQTTCQSI